MKKPKRVVLGEGELALSDVDGERASGLAYPTGYGIWIRSRCQWKRLSGIMVVGKRVRLVAEILPVRRAAKEAR